MSETNAERLERAKDYLLNTFIALARKNGKTQMCEDLICLIEQAERAQELENLIKSHAPEGRNYTNQQYVGLIRDFTRLEEALKFYANKDNYSHGYHDLLGELESAVEMDEGTKARNALRGV